MKAFLNRPIEGDWLNLWMDGLYVCQSAPNVDPRSASNFGSDATLVQQIDGDIHSAPISLA